MKTLNTSSRSKTKYCISKFSIFSQRQLAEIPKLILPDEEVLSVISGFYTAGSAILCITSKRILLIDKKFIRLNFEDIRFESISEVNYSHQMFIANLKFYYTGRVLDFKTWYKNELRESAQYVQDKMFESREAMKRSPKLQANDEAIIVEPEPQPELSDNSDQHLSHHLSRNMGWQRAERFMNTINFTKLGRQIVNLEVIRRH